MNERKKYHDKIIKDIDSLIEGYKRRIQNSVLTPGYNNEQDLSIILGLEAAKEIVDDNEVGE